MNTETTGPTETTAITDTDTTEVRALLDRARAAWNRGDGTAYGDCFTDDATDVTFTGTVYRGGQEIGRAHQALFDTFLKGTELHLDVRDIRTHGPDTAVVVTRGEVSRKPPRRLGKIATYTLVRTDRRGWRIAAVQKTRRKGLLEAVSFRLQPATRPVPAGG
ncbi:SgcJ/EcaC family oxidoreductase [Streptomyces sp. NPDC006435]|uniref:SgcJ/EcaC family oxidoreductase n=1 Tax=Streptomyces sp. NPDC006435 TaxID=3154300 RepID=UPI0033AE9CDD